MKNLKIKKSLSLILSLIMIMSTLSMLTVTSFAETSGDWEYSVNNNEATITRYNGSTANVTIPSKLGGCKVSSIGWGAFYNCTSLTSITIPDSVTRIGNEAFFGCTSLTSITIPNSVTSIEGFAFYKCTSLTRITIPDSVTSIAGSAFNGCTSLTSINVDGNNPSYCSVNGVLFNKDKSELIQYPEGKKDKQYSIPDSVTSIGDDAFFGCTSLTSITIPDSVTSIGWQAFSDCTSLTSITIPDSVTRIGNEAFFGCTSLTSITIPNSVTSIEGCAFYKCTSLTSITIPDSVTSIDRSAFNGCTSLTSINVDGNNPSYCSVNGVFFNKDKSELIQYPAGKKDKQYSIPDSVTSIGDGAFYGCTSLTSVIIPSNVTSIGDGAFSGCTSLTSITIPDSVTSIVDFAFSGCTSLTSVTLGNSVTSIFDDAFSGCTSLNSINVNSNNPSYCSVNGVLFNKDKSELIQYPEGKKDKQYSIPDSVTSIVDFAFSGCTSLTSITIPNSVASIGDFAFNGCTSLTSITIPNGVTSIGGDAFCDCTSLTSITLPDSVTNIGEYAFGYYYDTLDSLVKINDFKIYGGKGTAAETYAKDNKITFCEIVSFPDVKVIDWFADVVNYVAEKGYIKGYQNGKFGPNDSLKRQDFVCILARIDGADLKAYENVQSKLTDVKKGDYYAAAVNWAVDKGYISGYQNGKFGVNDSITREQVATILYNYMDKPEVENAEKILAKFPDANKVSSFAKTPVAWAVSNGIISGMGDGTVASTSGATRAQIAAIIQRMDTQGMFSK